MSDDAWEPPDNYGVICTANRQYVYVTTDVYDQICTQLDTFRDVQNYDMPMFVRFVDITGSEFRMRVAQIESIFESTPESRKRDIVMEKAHKGNRPFQDD